MMGLRSPAAAQPIASAKSATSAATTTRAMVDELRARVLVVCRDAARVRAQLGYTACLARARCCVNKMTLLMWIPVVSNRLAL
jgi:hypothetical protein